MTLVIVRFLPPIAALVTIIFLIIRFRLFSSSEHQGRPAILIGSLLVLSSALWQPARAVSDYNDWFVASAYPLIDASQMVALLIGLFSIVTGVALHMDYWQSRREALREREERLTLLDDLQRDARQPYQLLELFAISLREILSTLSGCSGAVFLINRGRRQFVLAASSGLSKQEAAGVEQYPYGGNIVTQAVELAEPMIGGGFEFTGRHRPLGDSRFRSTLVLPLVSGMERVGAVLLLADRDQAFTTTEIAYLSPVVEWLAEKVKSARLAREMAIVNRKADEQTARYQNLNDRLSNAARQISSSADLTPFCRSLVGLLGSSSVQLCAERDGRLEILAGSETIDEPSENLRTALVDAVSRSKPLIINQESTDEENSSRVVQSTLVCPIVGRPQGAALLLRQFNQAFVISDVDLGHIEPFVLLAQMALTDSDNHRLTLTRRKGIDIVLELLKLKSSLDDPNAGLVRFAKIVEAGLPDGSLVLPFSSDLEPLLYDNRLTELIDGRLGHLNLANEKGWFGAVWGSEKSEFLFGRKQIDGIIESFGDKNRPVLQALGRALNSPTFFAACPLAGGGKRVGLLLVFVSGLGAADRSEVERFLTLASSLFTLRKTVEFLSVKKSSEETENEWQGYMSSLTNDLNNALAAVIGKAELAASTSGLPAGVRSELEAILDEAEKAAELVRRPLARGKAPGHPLVDQTVPAVSATQAGPANESRETVGRLRTGLTSYLNQHHISGNLYMISGRPREIDLTADRDYSVAIGQVALREFFELFLRKLCSQMSDDDILTVSQYDHSGSVYLDACLHRKHFPPVNRLARSGLYRKVGDLLAERPEDSFLGRLLRRPVFCAVDPVGVPPAFYSFRFLPSDETLPLSPVLAAPPLSILAIDDQQVILDLIVAMGQSQGFEVTTASSGEAGLRAAGRRQFDIILTDLAMPDISGMEVARRLMAMGNNIPVVLITGWEASISNSDLVSAGISRVLYKPFRIEQLSELILSLTGQPH